MERLTVLGLVLGVGGWLTGCGGESSGDSCGQPRDGLVTLPQDDGAHQVFLEWWYWTGHLKAKDGRWFGFQEVFFQNDVAGTILQSTHAALTDIAAGKFSFTKLGPQAETPWEGTGSFDLALGTNTAKGGGGHDVLHAELEGATLDLTLEEDKRPMLQHGDGYQDYPFGGNTYYYSRARMKAKGTLTVGAETFQVEGTSWFDHQWGDLNQVTNLGWDWFALELDEQREIMLAVVLDGTTVVWEAGTVCDRGCATRELGPEDFEITPRGTWVSPHTGCTFPSGWDIQVDGLNLVVTPVLEDQELFGGFPQYWEGAATISGDASGRAYIELTGRCG